MTSAKESIYLPAYKYLIIKFFLWAATFLFFYFFVYETKSINQIGFAIVVILIVLFPDLLYLQKIILTANSITIKKLFFNKKKTIQYAQISKINKSHNPVFSSLNRLYLVTADDKCKIFYSYIKDFEKLEKEIRERTALNKKGI